MRWKRLTLRNFRGYKIKNEINLDADLVLIYGPNGYGKSTLADAIEWLLTANLNRYTGKGESEGREWDYVKNVGSEKEPEVKLEMTDPEVTLKRIRQSKETSNFIFQNGKDSQLRKFVKKDSRNEYIFTEWLINSHILAQERLQEFVKSSPDNRFYRLATLLGLSEIQQNYAIINDKYRNAIKKKDNKKEEYQDYQEYYNNEKEELKKNDQFDVPGNYSKLGKWLKEKFLNITKDKQTEKSVSESSNLKDIFKKIAEWIDVNKADKESKLNLIQSKIDVCENLLSNYDKYIENKNKKEELKCKIKEEKCKIKTIESELQEKVSESNNLELSIDEINKTIKEKKKIKDSLINAKEKYKNYLKANKYIERNEERYQYLSNLKSKKEKKYNKLESDYSKKQDKIELLNKKENKIKNKINDLNYYLNIYDKLNSKREYYNNIASNCIKVYYEIKVLKSKLNKIGTNLKKLKKFKKQISEKIDIEKKRINELNSLSQEMREYVKDQYCPLCKHNHGQKEKLLEKIDQSLDKKDNEKLIKLRKKESLVSKKLEKITNMYEKVERLMETSKFLKSKGKKIIKNGRFHKKRKLYDNIKKEDIEINKNMRNEIISSKNNLSEKLKEIQTDINHLKKKLEETSNDIEATGEYNEKLSYLLDKIKTKINEKNEHIYNWQNWKENNLEVVSLMENINIAEINKVIAKIEETINQQNNKLKSKKIKYRQIIKNKKDTKKLLQKKENIFENHQNYISELQKKIDKFQNQFKSLNINKNLKSIDILENYINNQKNKHQSLKNEINKINEIRKDLKIARKQRTVIDEKKELEKKKKKLDSLHKDYMAWEKTVDYLYRLRNEIQKAIKSKSEKRIKSIEKQINFHYDLLNPHPLWKEVKFSPVSTKKSRSDKNELRLMIKSPRFPDDYKNFDDDGKIKHPYAVSAKYALSTGQLNVLALSIFLALSEASNSPMDTIFLDDSIQALDDIHIAEFAEIIRRFLYTRQIILTTNNKNLFELLKKKCKGQKSRNKRILINEIVSVNKEGPVINDYYLNEKSNGFKVQ